LDTVTPLLAAWEDLPEAERIARTRSLRLAVRLIAGGAAWETEAVLARAESELASRVTKQVPYSTAADLSVIFNKVWTVLGGVPGLGPFGAQPISNAMRSLQAMRAASGAPAAQAIQPGRLAPFVQRRARYMAPPRRDDSLRF
jgi:hypothetical protein